MDALFAEFVSKIWTLVLEKHGSYANFAARSQESKKYSQIRKFFLNLSPYDMSSVDFLDLCDDLLEFFGECADNRPTGEKIGAIRVLMKNFVHLENIPTTFVVESFKIEDFLKEDSVDAIFSASRSKIFIEELNKLSNSPPKQSLSTQVLQLQKLATDIAVEAEAFKRECKENDELCDEFIKFYEDKYKRLIAATKEVEADRDAAIAALHEARFHYEKCMEVNKSHVDHVNHLAAESQGLRVAVDNMAASAAAMGQENRVLRAKLNSERVKMPRSLYPSVVGTE